MGSLEFNSDRLLYKPIKTIIALGEILGGSWEPPQWGALPAFSPPPHCGVALSHLPNAGTPVVLPQPYTHCGTSPFPLPQERCGASTPRAQKGNSLHIALGSDGSSGLPSAPPASVSNVYQTPHGPDQGTTCWISSYLTLAALLSH